MIAVSFTLTMVWCMQNTWVDPACGDGLCESPFEFASYGRFGCRADCGRLADTVDNLTTIQIDLAYNFEHPAGSIPATELTSQAQWNICPENGAPHGRDCYFSEDRSFDRTEGTVQEIIDDVPDGLWTINIKRDFFFKVKGAVRVRDRVEEQARQYTKIYVALQAADANHVFEEGVLQVRPHNQCTVFTCTSSACVVGRRGTVIIETASTLASCFSKVVLAMFIQTSLPSCMQAAISLAQTDLATLMKSTLEEEVQTARLDLALQLQATSIDQTQHDTAETDLEAYLTTMLDNVDSRGACPVLARFNTDGYPTDGANPRSVLRADTVWDATVPSVGFSAVSLNPPAATALTYNTLLPGSVNACSTACVCTKLESVAEAAYASRFSTMQDNLIARLDRNSGRLGAQRARKLELMRDIVDNTNELYDFIIDLSTGLQPLDNPEFAVLDDVISVYVDGPLAFGVGGQPNVADSLLKRTTITELDQDADPDALGILAQRCQVCSKAFWTPC